MGYELTLGAGPVFEAVTTAEAKNHLRVDISDDDILIDDFVSMAREKFEEENGRTMCTTTWKMVLDAWPRKPYIMLPRPPLASVTSVSYIDSDGNTTVWNSANYIVETLRTPGRIHLAENATWPSATLRAASPITITYVAGWSDVADIPKRYKGAILLLAGQYYENRENIVIGGSGPKELPEAFRHIAQFDRVFLP